MNGWRKTLDGLRESVAASSLGQRIWAWYELASVREQRAVQIGAVLLLGLLLALVVVLPLHDFRQAAQRDYRDAVETLGWMEANRHLVGERRNVSDEPLLATATRTARDADIDIRRYEPAGESGLNLWLENVPFAAVVRWLETLELEHGVATADLIVRRRPSAGRVDVRVVLER